MPHTSTPLLRMICAVAGRATCRLGAALALACLCCLADDAAPEPVIRGSAEWLRQVEAHAPAEAGLDDPSFGAESNPTGEPIGGGTGYSRLITPEAATVVVATGEELLDALGRAPPGTVVYVNDHAEIDLSGHGDIEFKEGVTVASGRGRAGSEGALVFTQTVARARLFRTAGPNVRLTGLRFEGPYPGRERLTQRPTFLGIYHPNVEVDNCEVFAWSCAAVGVGSGAVEGAWIHHNYIHHNQRGGLGYGVSLGRTHVLIEGNLFDFCRHATPVPAYPEAAIRPATTCTWRTRSVTCSTCTARATSRSTCWSGSGTSMTGGGCEPTTRPSTTATTTPRWWAWTMDAG